MVEKGLKVDEKLILMYGAFLMETQHKEELTILDRFSVTRKVFTTQLISGIAAAVAVIFSSCSATAEKPVPPLFDKARTAVMENHNMPPGFKRFRIEAKRRDGSDFELVGNFFTLEGDAGKVDLLTRSKNPQYFVPKVNFPAIKDDFRVAGKTVALSVAAAFTPDWKTIEGHALDDGKDVGEARSSRWQGLLVIKKGAAEILHLNEIGDFNAFLAEAKRQKWSVIQQIPVIHNGALDTIPPLAAGREFELRFFIERDTPHGLSRGVIHFHKKMRATDAVEILMQLRTADSHIKNALYLDAGSVSKGYFYDAAGTPYPMVDEGFSEREDGYTNLLTFYSE